MVKDWFAVIDLDLVTVVEDLKKVGSLGVGVAATRAAVAEQPSPVCCPPNEISNTRCAPACNETSFTLNSGCKPPTNSGLFP